VAVIEWKLDLQLSMQTVPITTDVVSSNLDQGEVYINTIKQTNKPYRAFEYFSFSKKAIQNIEPSIYSFMTGQFWSTNTKLVLKLMN
jgi:hypothetical protein